MPRLAALLAIALIAAACGDDGDKAATSSGASGSGATAQTPAATDPAPASTAPAPASTETAPATTAAAPATTDPAPAGSGAAPPITTTGDRPVPADLAQIVLAWSAAINRNDNAAAAALFAKGAIVARASLPADRQADGGAVERRPAVRGHRGRAADGPERRGGDVRPRPAPEAPVRRAGPPGRRRVRDRPRQDHGLGAGAGERRQPGHADAVDPDREQPGRVTARRAAGLFAAYRGPVAVVCAMIVLTAIIGLVPPFLLRDLVDNVFADGENLNTTRLNLLVAGMVAVPIVTGALGVWQTWLANRIGQQVMHDLRVAVYTHLQRLPLAFFTRTRTGEVQSRIANDIGGVQNVVTSTATSIAQNVTTVLATAVALFLLSWPLALASFVLLPFFALATRRVGDRRRRVAKDKQGTLADLRPWSRSRCRCRACCSRRRWGRAAS